MQVLSKLFIRTPSLCICYYKVLWFAICAILRPIHLQLAALVVIQTVLKGIAKYQGDRQRGPKEIFVKTDELKLTTNINAQEAKQKYMSF